VNTQDSLTPIPLAQLNINPSSYVDPNGFAFHFDQQIFRGIYPEQEAFYRNLFDTGLIDKWTKDFHLVDSKMSKFSIPELHCNAVVSHRSIAPLTYCVEWPSSLLQRAAITTLELNLELLNHNCILQDAYPWNILFEGTTPVFVDLTSIVPLSTPLMWPAYQQFINFFMNPLELAALGKGKIARGLLYDYINGISGEDLHKNLSLGYCFSHPLKLTTSFLVSKLNNHIQNNQKLKLKLQGAVNSSSKHQEHTAKIRKRFINGLLTKVKSLKVKGQSTTWTRYYADLTAEFSSDEKIKRVDQLLNQLKPQTVIDIGCNVGKYSILAARAGAKVIAMDSSEDSIEALVQHCTAEQLAITPIIGDVLCPTPAFGFLSQQFPPMVERFRSDVVLCLGVMHHLHISGRQSFERIAKLLNQLAKKAVIFEYVDATDGNNQLIDHGRKIEYSMASVSEALAKHFKITVFASDRETRRLLLCEKK
jgi:2-polyprenyl-3-methyl-5-hydroxy-6-metoxy-1,4-benzoquinol methylase